MTNEEILETLSANRKVTAFVRSMRDRGIEIVEKTLYRAVEEQGKTPRQRLVLEQARIYAEGLNPQFSSEPAE
jgi:hypothetical protein